MRDASAASHLTSVDRAEVLRHLALLEDTLGGNGSDGSKDVSEVPWKQLWQLLNLWDQVLSNAREECSLQAAQLVTRIVRLARLPNGALELDMRNLEGTGRDLKEYVVEQQEAVRSAYFALATHWRLMGVWQHLRARPTDIAGALRLLHRYILAPAGSPPLQKTCYITSSAAGEKSELKGIADEHTSRLRHLSRSLRCHPRAASLMSDVKGKGKQRSMNEQEMAAARKEIRHYRLILRESCPAEHLPLLMQSTARWMNALRVALTYVADVREALSTVEAVGMSTRDETKDGDGAGGGRDATDSPEHDTETSCREQRDPYPHRSLPPDPVIPLPVPVHLRTNTQRAQSPYDWQHEQPSPVPAINGSRRSTLSTELGMTTTQGPVMGLEPSYSQLPCRVVDRGTSPGLPNPRSAGETDAGDLTKAALKASTATAESGAADVVVAPTTCQAAAVRSQLSGQPEPANAAGINVSEGTKQATESQESHGSGTTATTAVSGYESLPSPQSMVETSPRLPSPADNEELLTCPPPGQTTSFETPRSRRLSLTSPSTGHVRHTVRQADEQGAIWQSRDSLQKRHRIILNSTQQTPHDTAGQSSFVSYPSAFVTARATVPPGSQLRSSSSEVHKADDAVAPFQPYSSPECPSSAQALSPGARSRLLETAEQNQRKLRQRRSQSPGMPWGEGAFGIRWPLKKQSKARSKATRPRSRPTPRGTSDGENLLLIAGSSKSGSVASAPVAHASAATVFPAPPEGSEAATDTCIIRKAALVTFADIDGSSEACSEDQADMRGTVQDFLMQECDDFEV